jgi:hypothetical protein
VRILVRSQSAVSMATKQQLSACQANFEIRNGRWLVQVPYSTGCRRFLSEAKLLPPETRKNLGRHLQSLDPEIGELIEALR